VATALARNTRNTWARTAKKVVTCVEGAMEGAMEVVPMAIQTVQHGESQFKMFYLTSLQS